jgi:hypothetical protein
LLLLIHLGLVIVKSMIRIILFLLISHLAHSQILVQGKVMDTNNRPIPYVNIGILNSTFGTISNEDGSFAMRIPVSHQFDSVLFSALGYVSKSYAVADALQKSLVVSLADHIIYLDDVEVNTKRESNKYFEFGNSHSRGGVLETDTLTAGAALAVLINENTNPDFSFPVYLNKAQIRIFRNNLPSFKMRVRFYEVDTVTNQPGNDLLQQSIVMESEMRNGWLEFDLSKLNFIVRGPFFMGFERIITKEDRELIASSYQKFIKENPKKLVADTVLVDGKKEVRQMIKGGGIDLPGTFIAISTTVKDQEKFVCYTRDTSFDPWKRSHGILTATVTLSNQPTSVPNK